MKPFSAIHLAIKRILDSQALEGDFLYVEVSSGFECYGGARGLSYWPEHTTLKNVFYEDKPGEIALGERFFITIAEVRFSASISEAIFSHGSLLDRSQ